MDLLLESKKGNKDAFHELTQGLEIKLYKTSRFYFTTEKEVLEVVKETLKELFREIINARTEEQIVPLAMKLLIAKCEGNLAKYEKDEKWLLYISSVESKDKYEAYRYKSIEEEYITSLPKNLRLVSILYYYDELAVKDIAQILKMSESNVNKIIEEAREKLYEMIINEGVERYNDYV